MIRNFVRFTATMAAVFSMAGGSALAADGGDTKAGVKTKLYIFEGSVVDGSTNGPTLSVERGHKNARFARLLSLKKDLVPGIFNARRSPTFK